MVYLISGPSHVGKTLLATKLIAKANAFCLSLDHLKMGLIRSKILKVTVAEDEKITNLMWPIVREMIKTAIENDQDLILEGIYIPFDYKKYFEPFYLERIKCLFLIMSKEYINRSFDKIIAYQNVVEKRIEGSISKKTMIDDNELFYKKCVENKCPFILIDNEYDVNANLFDDNK